MNDTHTLIKHGEFNEQTSYLFQDFTTHLYVLRTYGIICLCAQLVD